MLVVQEFLGLFNFSELSIRMVHMMNATRAARPGKEKPAKAHVKSSRTDNQHGEPTKLSQTKARDVEDPDLEMKIRKVTFNATSRT